MRALVCVVREAPGCVGGGVVGRLAAALEDGVPQPSAQVLLLCRYTLQVPSTHAIQNKYCQFWKTSGVYAVLGHL